MQRTISVLRNWSGRSPEFPGLWDLLGMGRTMMDDIDRIMLAAMTEYEKANPESEESFKVRWARYRNKMYMREYRRRRTHDQEV